MRTSVELLFTQSEVKTTYGRFSTGWVEGGRVERREEYATEAETPSGGGTDFSPITFVV